MLSFWQQTLNPRLSSTTLSVHHRQDVFDGSSDMVIAQELLNQPPRIPRRQTSLNGFLNELEGHQVAHGQVDYDGFKNEARTRNMVRSSTTWTSSSAEIPEDRDEIDDRTTFVAEFNRLAQKVRISMKMRGPVLTTHNSMVFANLFQMTSEPMCVN